MVKTWQNFCFFNPISIAYTSIKQKCLSAEPGWSSKMRTGWHLCSKIMWNFTWEAAARLVDPQLERLALDRFVADTNAAERTGALARFFRLSRPMTETRKLGLFHIDMEPFTFYTSHACLELGDTLLLGVRNQHQVMTVHQWHSCKITYSTEMESSRLRTRALRHTNPHANHVTALTIDLHIQLQALEYMLRMTCTAH